MGSVDVHLDLVFSAGSIMYAKDPNGFPIYLGDKGYNAADFGSLLTILNLFWRVCRLCCGTCLELGGLSSRLPNDSILPGSYRNRTSEILI